MCVSCISTSEQVAAEVALAFALLREPVHQALAAAGVVDPPDPVRRDARTVGFLRALDLDPTPILGAATVEGADAWVPARRRRRASAGTLRPAPSNS